MSNDTLLPPQYAEFFTGKTILLTGAAGFIGSHLSDALVALGAKVIGVDNFLTGRPQNIAQLRDNPHFSLLEFDLTTASLADELQDIRPDVVLHFASPASPPRYQAHPVATYLVNSQVTHQLLTWLQQVNPQARFLFASTSEVYGDPEVHPQPESYWGNVNPNGARACYDESKRMGETICGVFDRDLGMDTRLVRIFNTYGPRIDPVDGRVIPQFVGEMLSGKPYTIYGSGNQTRSYCFVADLVAGILSLTAHPEGRGKTVNLGNPQEFTVRETAQLIHEVGVELGKTTSDYIEENHPLPKDDPTRRRPDISRAKELLGWEPKVSVKDGLKATIEAFG